jgi:hypothetical protein
VEENLLEYYRKSDSAKEGWGEKEKGRRGDEKSPIF